MLVLFLRHGVGKVDTWAVNHRPMAGAHVRTQIDGSHSILPHTAGLPLLMSAMLLNEVIGHA